ncbi:hypothetical protein V6N11_035375 [Hibiscus sabdariffa]|uniref:Uncharacterized protein n=1 Tax=Hibiscus sabdariffa TaxID=183260 RepID=A0ABR2R0B6_9ROSI
MRGLVRAANMVMMKKLQQMRVELVAVVMDYGRSFWHSNELWEEHREVEEVHGFSRSLRAWSVDNELGVGLCWDKMEASAKHIRAKTVVSSGLRKHVLQCEAEARVHLGGLIGVKTIGSEEAIIQENSKIIEGGSNGTENVFHWCGESEVEVSSGVWRRFA